MRFTVKKAEGYTEPHYYIYDKVSKVQFTRPMTDSRGGRPTRALMCKMAEAANAYTEENPDG